MYKTIFNVFCCLSSSVQTLVKWERKFHAPDIGVQSKCADPRRSEASQDGDVSEVIQKQAEQEQSPVVLLHAWHIVLAVSVPHLFWAALPCDFVSCRQHVLTPWLALFDPCGFPWWASIHWHVWFSRLCLMSLMPLSWLHTSLAQRVPIGILRLPIFLDSQNFHINFKILDPAMNEV